MCKEFCQGLKGRFMNRFYIDRSQVSESTITILGDDVNHIKNVLRMKIGEAIVLCDCCGTDYHCKIQSFEGQTVEAVIESLSETDTELKTKIYLFQGLPKKDKMELIVQKAVELGVTEVIPVMMKRTIVKLEDKKKELKKLERWQSIATSAAKQSNRGIIPKVSEVLTYKEALAKAKEMDLVLLPYENENGMASTREVVRSIRGKQSVGIFIGPEGGYEESEIEMAKELDMKPITLGNRILRTETAGLAMLSILMFELED